MGDLSKNFSLDEFTCSAKAEELGIQNTPTPEHLANIKHKLVPFCQDLRDKLGRSVHVMSGYRNPDVNRAVGGVPNSAHALGFAADLVASGMTAKALAKFIAADRSLMAQVDQVILETSRGVVHVGTGPKRRQDVLTQAGPAGTPFQDGIV